jgi:uncharacterized protein
MEPSKADKVSQNDKHEPPCGGGVWCLAIGFSVRALAEALFEVGFRVIAVDAFGDYDTRLTAKVPQIISNWGASEAELSLQPHRWSYCSNPVEVSRLENPVPVFLAGGCENWLELLRKLHLFPEYQVLSGDTAQISGLRSQANLREATKGTDVHTPPVRKSPSVKIAGIVGVTERETSHEWLVKSSAHAGGLGVSRFKSSANDSSGRTTQDFAKDQYLQKRIAGRSLGASCIVTKRHGKTEVDFIGATESWSCDDWPAPTEFIYRGSFGPIDLSQQQKLAICQFAHNLVHQAAPDWLGWIQMDFIEDSNGQLWVLEVNPRWTAGMEVLRLAGLANMAALHAHAHGIDTSLTNKSMEGQASAVEFQATQAKKYCAVGKAIYYATSDLKLTRNRLNRLHGLCGDGFSDLPSIESEGSTIQAGHPLLTISFQLQTPCETSNSLLRQLVLEALHRKRQLVDRLMLDV